MTHTQSKVACYTPTPGKQPCNIAKWKYEAVKQAILAVVPSEGEGLSFRELPQRVAEQLGAQQMAAIGSANWYCTTVKLDLEVKGLLRRVAGPKPQRLLLNLEQN